MFVLFQGILEPIQSFFWSQAAMDSIKPKPTTETECEKEVYFDVQSKTFRVENDDDDVNNCTDDVINSEDDGDDIDFTVRPFKRKLIYVFKGKLSFYCSPPNNLKCWRHIYDLLTTIVFGVQHIMTVILWKTPYSIAFILKRFNIFSTDETDMSQNCPGDNCADHKDWMNPGSK